MGRFSGEKRVGVSGALGITGMPLPFLASNWIGFLPPPNSSVTLLDLEECLILQNRDPTDEISLWMYTYRKQTEMPDCQKEMLSHVLSHVLAAGRGQQGPKNHIHGRIEQIRGWDSEGEYAALQRQMGAGRMATP